jgi:hypothetical protein
MKKTHRIQLVLITAALAACERPLYQRDPDYPPAGGDNPTSAYNPSAYNPSAYDPSARTPTSAYYPPMGDQPDSSNSCPLAQSQLPPDYYLWYEGLQPFDFYYGSGFSLDGYYMYHAPVTIARGGFGHIGHGRIGSSAHS